MRSSREGVKGRCEAKRKEAAASAAAAAVSPLHSDDEDARAGEPGPGRRGPGRRPAPPACPLNLAPRRPPPPPCRTPVGPPPAQPPTQTGRVAPGPGAHRSGRPGTGDTPVAAAPPSQPPRCDTGGDRCDTGRDRRPLSTTPRPCRVDASLAAWFQTTASLQLPPAGLRLRKGKGSLQLSLQLPANFQLPAGGPEMGLAHSGSPRALNRAS